MPTISLKVPKALDDKLSARARLLSRSKSELTRVALSRYLDEGRKTSSSLDLVRDLVGTVRGPGDLSSNKKHLRGYGR